ELAIEAALPAVHGEVLELHAVPLRVAPVPNEVAFRKLVVTELRVSRRRDERGERGRRDRQIGPRAWHDVAPLPPCDARIPPNRGVCAMLRRVTASPAISVSRLVADRGSRPVLEEISFDVAPGEIVGLLGPNGAGKTTTLGVLSTLIPYRGGD